MLIVDLWINKNSWIDSLSSLQKTKFRQNFVNLVRKSSRRRKDFCISLLWGGGKPGVCHNSISMLYRAESDSSYWIHKHLDTTQNSKLRTRTKWIDTFSQIRIFQRATGCCGIFRSPIGYSSGGVAVRFALQLTENRVENFCVSLPCGDEVGVGHISSCAVDNRYQCFIEPKMILPTGFVNT